LPYAERIAPTNAGLAGPKEQSPILNRDAAATLAFLADTTRSSA
jgi:hypothetical protein